jgi:LacI family transcriptional regulator
MSTRPKAPRARRAATLADVGREAGVSAMAASAVLNGARTSSRISEATRARVLEAADRLRYRPNATARGLASRRMNTLGVLALQWGDELNQYFLELFNGVLQGAAAAGQTTTVFGIHSWSEAPLRIAEFCDGRIDGLIMLAPMLGPDAADWLPEHTPFVFVHGNEEVPGVVDLQADEEAGAFEMVSRMLALGHRRILHVGGPQGSLGAQRRAQGYLRAHAAAGLQPAPGHLVEGGYETETGRRAMEAWLQRHRGELLPQAVFGANDAAALGCMDALYARGLRVPQDVSVAGFDNTLLARVARLATVHQPLAEMGRRAVEILVARVDARLQERPWTGPNKVLFPTEFVPGATLAAPPSESPRID